MKHARRKSKKPLLTAVSLLLVGLTLGMGGYLLTHMGGGLEYEKNAVNGAIGGGVDDIAALEELVDKSMISMYINANPVWDLKVREEGVNWLIENPAAQSTKLIRVEVIREDNGETIYETGALRPGTYVTGTLPDVELEPGEYPCTAYFFSYDVDTEEFLGKAGTQITVYVLE